MDPQSDKLANCCISPETHGLGKKATEALPSNSLIHYALSHVAIGEMHFSFALFLARPFPRLSRHPPKTLSRLQISRVGAASQERQVVARHLLRDVSFAGANAKTLRHFLIVTSDIAPSRTCRPDCSRLFKGLPTFSLSA